LKSAPHDILAEHWIGNSPDIADRHYLNTTDDHFRMAVLGLSARGVAEKVLQNPALKAAETGRTANAKRLIAGTRGVSCIYCTKKHAPPRGNEQAAGSSGKTSISENGGARGGAIVRQTCPLDSDLANIIDRWPTLPADAKAANRTIVERPCR
jgi:hypothetical protein